MALSRFGIRVVSPRKMRVVAAIALTLSWSAALCAPVQEKHAEVIVLHGGIGEEDRAAMQDKAAEYNLRLTFAVKVTGAYLSGVKLVVNNAAGANVLDTVSSGPWLLARLPAGEFTLSATSGGQTLTHKVSITPASRRDWVFRFEPSSAQ